MMRRDRDKNAIEHELFSLNRLSAGFYRPSLAEDQTRIKIYDVAASNGIFENAEGIESPAYVSQIDNMIRSSQLMGSCSAASTVRIRVNHAIISEG